ncbi:MAG: uroporphyrinogen-III synthase [Verrucomicrobia bacterium]|nr:uroporphyrinogen-III synthase [Verrucomicrobiota bacterium]MBS0636291.1 uroporphyrinogen-III synthase [Verrucomicrobiota bacterium]
MVVHIGLEAPSESIHLPLIAIQPLEPVTLIDATHVIVTSKTTVRLAKEPFQKCSSTFISVGAQTTASLKQIGIQNILTATNECQEGIIELLENLNLTKPTFFWAHSALSRPILRDYFVQKNYPCTEHILYNTVFVEPQVAVDFDAITDIHFSSPSCVDAFFHFYGKPPSHIRLHAKGPVTEAKLRNML